MTPTMRRASRLALLSVACRAASALSTPKLAPKLTLHVYDHCPFCNRAEFLMGHLGVQYERVLHGYGRGADPDACGGTGYEPSKGPVELTGFKMLPVLVGEGVPAPKGMQGMPESLEICSYVAAAAEGKVAPATGRGDLDDWRKRFSEAATPLIRVRIPKMPVVDWADPRDAAYARWKYESKFGFDYGAAEAATSKLLPKVSALLAEAEGLLRGTTVDGKPCLNSWGFSMDDVLLLPDLRMLSCVQGVEWPASVKGYLDAHCAAAQCKSYAEHAVP